MIKPELDNKKLLLLGIWFLVFDLYGWGDTLICLYLDTNCFLARAILYQIRFYASKKGLVGCTEAAYVILGHI